MRLKKSFKGIMDNGTNYVASKRFIDCFTGKELKVKPKTGVSSQKRVGE
jgi:hypothetical protein